MTTHPLSEDRALPAAFSLRNNPACYIAVIGAGMSRESGIPLANEILEDLVNQVAATQGQHPDDPWDWYQKTYGTEPTYQSVLEGLGPGAGDRHGLLRTHFARRPEDEPPLRQPNDAHAALAEFARRGLIKVFITTNFDTLIEDALTTAGLNPTVIATEEDLRQAPPVETLEAVVFHVHGVWNQPDTLRNTDAELSGYPDWTRKLLDRLLQGRGYVLLGWSAKYDPQLRDALSSNHSGRYSTYWLDLAAPSGAGHDLQTALGANFLSGHAAQSLNRIRSTIATLDAQTSVATSPAAVQVAAAKRAIATGARPLDALELINATTDAVRALPSMNLTNYNDGDIAGRRAELLNAIRDTASLVMLTAGQGSEADFRTIGSSIRALSAYPEGHGGMVALLAQTQMPGLVLLVAAGVGATSEEQWGRVNDLLAGFEVRDPYNDNEAPLATSLSLTEVLGSTHAITMLHDYLASTNKAAGVMSAARFDEAWERFEYLWALAATSQDRTLGYPHLTIRDARRGEYGVEIQGWLTRNLVKMPELRFVSPEAIEEYAARINDAANKTAWSTIPPGRGGSLPSGRWRMDETGDTAVTDAERAAWEPFIK